MPSHHTHHHASKSRGHRQCDQCGAIENPAIAKFRKCGGCLSTQYCSTNCQKVHWPGHRAVCVHTTEAISSSPEHIVHGLRKFAESYNDLLGWVAFQALQLRRHPANIRQRAFLVELSPRNHSDRARRFTIAGTHIISRSYISDPVVQQDIQRREHRARSMGGFGAMVVVLQCGGVSQVMPIEIQSGEQWRHNEEWSSVFHHCIEAGLEYYLPSNVW
ncbi:hypothetical protein CYLTODRAFT_349672 [Cylindrobasidium torrendii FP15055 ss-10]|uniref:MYND-type domain-containing protein n=1 Tax=Cylindrobasidium torrendii FP15055 ss-10 TaxID=1314674 RepID=A0A0D7BGZ6_9AGAR|nr:hypothetical protein CYLTODRAFT_349672 [Cylindrobasidium torrendii FP15055 ss-10]